MWLVILDRGPKLSDFREGFFPRQVHYKADAERLVKEVKAKGGKAHFEKVKIKKGE